MSELCPAVCRLRSFNLPKDVLSVRILLRETGLVSAVWGPALCRLSKASISLEATVGGLKTQLGDGPSWGSVREAGPLQLRRSIPAFPGGGAQLHSGVPSNLPLLTGRAGQRARAQSSTARGLPCRKAPLVTATP